MKRRVWLSALLFAGLAGLAWLVLRPHEPLYQGKTFSQWLQQDDIYAAAQPLELHLFAEGDHPSREFEEGGRLRRKPFQDLVKHFGTNGIPTLGRMINARDSNLKLRLIQLAQKQSIVKVQFIPAARKRFVAFQAFQILGRDAAPATPALIRIYEEAGTLERQKQILEIIRHLGPGARVATPLLLGATTNADAEIRRIALDSLWGVRPDPKLALVPLLKSLQDPDSMASFVAACAIEGLKGDKMEFAEELEELLRAQDHEWVVGLLLQTVMDNQPMVVGTSAWALGAFGEEAKPAVPVLVTVVEGKWRGGTGTWLGSVGAPLPTRVEVAEALRKIDPETAATLLPKYPELAK